MEDFKDIKQKHRLIHIVQMMKAEMKNQVTLQNMIHQQMLN